MACKMRLPLYGAGMWESDDPAQPGSRSRKYSVEVRAESNGRVERWTTVFRK